MRRGGTVVAGAEVYLRGARNYDPTILNEALLRLGTSTQITPSYSTTTIGVTSDVTDDPLTAGIEALNYAASGTMSMGEGSTCLVRVSGACTAAAETVVTGYLGGQGLPDD